MSTNPRQRGAANATPTGKGRGLALYVGAELANKAARFAAAVILARELSVNSYGLVSVGVAVSGVTVMLTALGFSELGARDAAVASVDTGWLTGRVLVARLAGAGATTLALVLAAALARGSLVPLVAMVGLMSLAMSSSSEWLLRGSERLGTLGVADLAGGLTVLAGCAAMAASRASTTLGMASFAAGEIVTAAICWLASGRRALPRLGVAGLRGMFARSWPIWLSSLAFYAYYANVDTIILAATRSQREAGLYTAAYRVFLAANLVSIAAAYAQLPAVSRAVAHTDVKAASASLARGSYLLACYGALVVGVAEIGGHAILGTLYGARFAGMSDVLTILCLGIAWYAVGFPVGYTLIGREKSKGFLAGSATAASLNLGLNAILIPMYGPIGAAIATFVAFAAACAVWMVAHGMVDRSGRRLLVALLLMSLAGLATLLLPASRVAIGTATLGGAALFAARRRDDFPQLGLLRRLRLSFPEGPRG